MTIEYESIKPDCPGVQAAFSWDPFAYKQTTDAESRFGYRDQRDPEQAPTPERGDKYLIIGTVVGVVIGSVAGLVIGGNLLDIGGVFLGLIGGAIVGGIIGVTIGGYFKKRMRAKE